MNSVNVVGSYFKALASGDTKKAFSYFHPNITWSQPGNNQFSGIKKGPEQIGGSIGKMIEYSKGSLVVAPAGEMMVSDNLVAAPVRFTAKKGNKSMDMGGIDLFEVIDEKITKVWLFSEDQSKEDDFWG